MKNNDEHRRYFSKPLTAKGGAPRGHLRLVDEAKNSVDSEELYKSEEFRLPCVDAVHRFGKKSGST